VSFVLDRIGLSIGNDVGIDDVSLRGGVGQGGPKGRMRVVVVLMSLTPAPSRGEREKGVFERGASPWRRGRSADISMEETRGRP
jgi:hypothetical protein